MPPKQEKVKITPSTSKTNNQNHSSTSPDDTEKERILMDAESGSNRNVVTLRVPPFWQNDPELWFAQVEARFFISNISSDEEKYYTIVAAIEDPMVLNQVSDILRTPPVEDKYKILKENLIIRFTESREHLLNKLLTGLSLGNKKPSQLLREMRNIAPKGITEEVMRSLWLQRMPISVRCILSASEDVELTKLADIADRILETSNISQTMAITASSDNMNERLTKLEKAVQNLTVTVKDIQKQRFVRSSSREKHNSHELTTGKGTTCYYHRKFGSQATKCRTPCTFDTTKQLNARQLSSVEARKGNVVPESLATETRLYIRDKNTGYRFLVDSGSALSVIPRSMAKRKLQPSLLKLYAANGSEIVTYGKHMLEINLGLQRTFKWLFIVAETTCAILGADFLSHFGLSIDLQKQYLRDTTTRRATRGKKTQTSVFSISTVRNNIKLQDSRQKFVDITLPTWRPNFKKKRTVKKPLEAPYTGPFEIIKRINDYTFLIKIKNNQVAISTERLKPAFIARQDIDKPNESNLQVTLKDTTSCKHPLDELNPWLLNDQQQLKTYSPSQQGKKKIVTFADNVTRKGGDVADLRQSTPSTDKIRRKHC